MTAYFIARLASLGRCIAPDLKGITYMEAIVAPFPDWEDWNPAIAPVFRGFRSPAGEEMVLENNLFVERVLPGAILVGRQRDLRRTWPNQTEVTVRGSHFMTEDSPDEIGAAIAAWIGGMA